MTLVYTEKNHRSGYSSTDTVIYGTVLDGYEAGEDKGPSLRKVRETPTGYREVNKRKETHTHVRK